MQLKTPLTILLSILIGHGFANALKPREASNDTPTPAFRITPHREPDCVDDVTPTEPRIPLPSMPVILCLPMDPVNNKTFKSAQVDLPCTDQYPFELWLWSSCDSEPVNVTESGCYEAPPGRDFVRYGALPLWHPLGASNGPYYCGE